MAEITLGRYRYVPCDVELTVGGTTYQFRNGSITYLNLITDYVGRRLPVIQLGIEMEIDIIAEVYQNRDEARMKLSINEQRLDENDRVVSTSRYLQHSFSIIPAMEQTVYITSTDSGTEKYADPMKQLQNFELYLVDMDAVNWFTKRLDINLETATYAQMLLVPFLLRNIPAEMVIATPPQLGGSVDEVTAPIGSLIGNIRHLNNTYGLYDGEPIIFYDLQDFYCISKQQPNIVLEDPPDYGTITFILLNPEHPDHKVHGSYDDKDNETHWINLNQEPHIFDDTAQDSSAKFSTVTTVDSTGRVDKTTIDESATTMEYLYAKNELSSAQLINETMTGPRVSLVALDSSVRFLKPYKDYTFAVDTSYENLRLSNRIFRLIQWTLGIRREGVNTYLSEVSMTLLNPQRDLD